VNLAKKKNVTMLCFSAVIPVLLLVAVNPYANHKNGSDDPRVIMIVGGEQLHVNKMISSDFRFSLDGPLHVKQGDTIVIKESTGDGHTLTFVDASALPSTFNGVIFCGNPAIVKPGFVGSAACVKAPGYPFFLHLTHSFPPPWLPIPTSCLPGPICNQFVDGGTASNTNTLGLDTPWSFKADGSVSVAGDSILILPGQIITVTVTAAPGTHLHFVCIFHPWMQGEIIVDPASD
jgi:hypothetical protein